MNFSGAPFTPRPYQIEARAAVRAMWSEHGPGGTSPLIIAATGTGKTLTALAIAQDFLIAGGRVVWIAHRRELLTQPLADLQRHWPQFYGGIVQAARDDAHAQVVFASVQTLRSDERLQEILRHGYPALLVVDEAHHSLSPTHRQVIAALRGPETLVLGLTATPDREDNQDLRDLWDIAYTFGPTEAIAGGWLVPPWAAVDRLAELDEALAEVPMSGADYDEEALGKALLLHGIVQHTVEAMRTNHAAERLPYRAETASMCARGRSVMVFCASVEQASTTCEALRADGWEARWVCATTPDTDRSRLLRLFREGRLKVLVNVFALTEGTDLPIASCIVLARPFRSWGLFVQGLGRGMRLHMPSWDRSWGPMNANDPHYTGKRDCFCLDLAGATSLHSIVSAPVLIGGTHCPVAADGRHHYELANAGRGKCTLCGNTVACFASILQGADGSHDWVDADGEVKRKCSHCDRPQCLKSPDGRHVWADLATEGITICVECDAEIPLRADALQSLVGKIRAPNDAEIDWLRVRDVVPETWAADIDGQGLVLVVGDRRTASWTCWWVRKGAKKARPLASGAVPREEVRLRCADLLKRARRGSARSGWKPTEAQHRYADELGIDISGCRDVREATLEITRAKARERALALQLAQVPA
jgi:superfamily II DNA or RNA helicase